MKYEKLADALVSLLQGNDYQYRMYKGDDGTRTSNPYVARYFYVSNPNMMFIIDESDNTLTVHKSNIPFDVFRTLHKTLRNLTKKYFVNLEMKDYNKSFTPKDFSPTILRKNYKLDNIKNEGIVSERKQLRERYQQGNHTVDISETNDTMVMSLDGSDGFSIPYKIDELIPYIVEHSLVNGKVDIGFIRNLYSTYEKYRELNEQANTRPLSLSEQKLVDNYSKFFCS